MIARLDALLGRVTMYRLVAYVLGGLQLLAVLFAVSGLVQGVDPLALVVSFAVLVAVALAVDRGLATLFRVRAHTISTVITAQILFFLIGPRLDVVVFAGIALAAAVAVASKYLLAVRGRHVVNPAAFGVLVHSVVAWSVPELATKYWWVGTLWLVPFTIAGGALILFRTRRLPMGGVFVLVAAAAGVAFFVSLGADPAQAVEFVVLASPVFFLAGFMLSEPLTLPPRRWQQLAYAALVGVLMWGTLWIPVVGNQPDFALVVGNVLAFVVGRRRGIRLEFVGRRALGPTSWEFDFRPQRPVAFQPGQYMELTLPHGGSDARGWRRVFSIASAPGELVRFGIRLPERSSSFKRALLGLEPGTVVPATTVGGDFVLPRDPARPLLLVAGGIGITPFVGHLEQAAAEPAGRDIAVVYAISSLDDLAYADRLQAAGCSVCLASPERPQVLPAGWTWIGPDRLSGESLLDAVPDVARREAFLSGPPAMVAALRPALRRAGVRRIRTDVFIGY